MTPARQIGQYRLDELLGGGRTTQTYQAFDTVRKRTVALKVFRREAFPGAAGEQALHRLFQQAGPGPAPERPTGGPQPASSISDLIHPHLAWVWETGEVEGQFVIVERYVHGISLAQALAESGVFPWQRARQVVEQVAQGLDFAHARGWAHGAISPRNILIGDDVGAVVTGFGYAFQLLKRGAREAPAQADLLEQARYWAPEVWDTGVASAMADQYAVACVLAEMLSGKPLFDAPALEDLRARHQQGLQLQGMQFAWLASAPWQIEQVLGRALARQPAARFPSLGEMAAALDKLAGQQPLDEGERARRQALAQAWQEAEQQSRMQAEEAARLAALEQARREVQEQVRRELARPGQHEPVEPEHREPAEPEPGAAIQALEAQPAALPGVVEGGGRAVTSRRRSRMDVGGRRWYWWAGLAILLLAMGGLWLSWGAGDGAQKMPSPTPVEITLAASPLPQIVPSLPPTSSPGVATAQPVASPGAASGVTATATHTPTPSLTATIKPSQTPSSTWTETLSPSPTRTRTPTPINRRRDLRDK